MKASRKKKRCTAPEPGFEEKHVSTSFQINQRPGTFWRSRLRSLLKGQQYLGPCDIPGWPSQPNPSRFHLHMVVTFRWEFHGYIVVYPSYRKQINRVLCGGFNLMVSSLLREKLPIHWKVFDCPSHPWGEEKKRVYSRTMMNGFFKNTQNNPHYYNTTIFLGTCMGLCLALVMVPQGWRVGPCHMFSCLVLFSSSHLGGKIWATTMWSLRRDFFQSSTKW